MTDDKIYLNVEPVKSIIPKEFKKSTKSILDKIKPLSSTKVMQEIFMLDRPNTYQSPKEFKRKVRLKKKLVISGSRKSASKSPKK